ncbi:hypothetical protein CGMCC3_g7033 [Colletotrichum fructicola]|uniref:Uncharacterized protein n=1 Tax=Colletotrichum fructicola (strain Nara gc5) TaxID=1213859 RepID=L2GC12_COLFN|nr:uncharacterized protein CGMCC3_g7033 [Colletotrichum fructicola]KAE9576735.1 hypothetical protein CGMCC3_g7033 [Colletotrichum fructicola]KAF4413090.1 hypothetical protein CFRS1_v004107 [Colletotrichum fructicola]KAF4492966.1 hypothetical protein CGGC5_v001355 [Colletotrichum fructicola Nara gc5]KAF4889404.1 hypothetical protein CGCFRS4_v009375 [Colletotrichum fructicola]
MATYRRKRQNSLGPDDEAIVQKKSRVGDAYRDEMAEDTHMPSFILREGASDNFSGSILSEDFTNQASTFCTSPNDPNVTIFPHQTRRRIRLPRVGDTRSSVFDMEELDEEEEREFGPYREPTAGSSSNAPSSGQSQQARAGAFQRARDPSPILNPRVVEGDDKRSKDELQRAVSFEEDGIASHETISSSKAAFETKFLGQLDERLDITHVVASSPQVIEFAGENILLSIRNLGGPVRIKIENGQEKAEPPQTHEALACTSSRESSSSNTGDRATEAESVHEHQLVQLTLSSPLNLALCIKAQLSMSGLIFL